ncbi:hypothetical protein M0R72_18490 [Candidatus Pacearchaeota archaeon]|nr:hypothetical protein [Candidatus Pacearchaeota archaeon]
MTAYLFWYIALAVAFLVIGIGGLLWADRACYPGKAGRNEPEAPALQGRGLVGPGRTGGRQNGGRDTKDGG